jgi:hypothetical protein
MAYFSIEEDSLTPHYALDTANFMETGVMALSSSQERGFISNAKSAKCSAFSMNATFRRNA